MRDKPKISQSDQQWIFVDRCPACGNTDYSGSDLLDVEEYRFGDESIVLPERGIRLITCGRCKLVFKDTLPSPCFLSEVVERNIGEGWSGNYDYADEARVIRRLVDREPVDLLDIGASNGGLLKALDGVTGRRSALDIVVHPGVERWISGELVHDLADSDSLSWSEKPYDIVAMFDVIEHLYNPDQAFTNLRRLVKPGGFVVVETGDLDSSWPRRFGCHHWWYTGSFAHHVFWARGSLEDISVRHGFRVVSFERKRQKEQSAVPFRQNLLRTAKTALYNATPVGYGKLAQAVGKPGVQPWSPFTRDHFRAILR